MAHFNSFFNICSLGSSVNAKKKFWVVSSSSSNVCDFFCLRSSVETTICLIFGKNFCTCHKLLSFCIKTIWKAQKNPPKNLSALLFMFCYILIQKPFSNTYLTRFIFPVVKNMFKVIKITLLEATFFITLNVLMTVALSSLKIGRTSCCQPEKIIKK